MTQCAAARSSCALPLLISLCLFGVGCATGKTSPDASRSLTRYQFPKTASSGFDAWAAGDEAGAQADAGDEASMAIEALFLQAEMDFWAGDVERAFDRHMQVVRRQPSHPLVRLSAARINDLSNDVIDFRSRLVAQLGDVTYESMHPLAASYLSMAGQQAALEAWRASRADQPFLATSLGLPLDWRHTPVLSRLRLTDFDAPFLPEQQAQLSETYLSPADAEDVAINHKPSYPYISSNISLSPGLEHAGIYYMETFATVTADSPQVYWVYANFAGAARLWVDGEEIIERREQDYEAGKRWRRVSLAPGTHRVLIKLANQPRYRDWFDLTFLNKDATLSGGSRVEFSRLPPASYSPQQGGVKLLSETHVQDVIDPFIVHDVKAASDVELYLGALAAHYDRSSDHFTRAYDALIARRPEFAAAYGLKSLQVKTLWEVPSTLRDDISLKALRLAYGLHPESIQYTVMLGNWLKNKGESREVEALYRQAKQDAVLTQGDGVTLRNVGALNTWAAYLEGEGWDALAEQAYAEALQVAPSNCGAASSLQSMLYAREEYRAPEAITPRAAMCPSLQDTWMARMPERYDDKLAMAKRDALRYPYNTASQLEYARALRSHGEPTQAEAALVGAVARMPWSETLMSERVDEAFAGQGLDAALALLDDYEKRYTNASWQVWKRAELGGELPLTDLMMDARKVALELAIKEPVSPVGSSEQAAANSAGDEAFYVIDFAAKRYFNDGTSVQLTHTLVRVMTKNAIDRFGELEVPAGARLIHARTIKQDGSIQTPESVSGKDTLSMPGLAEGDFVELAYLDYESSYLSSRTHREGAKFFFKMKGISSLNSEYVIINPSGEVLRFHDAPQPEEFIYKGQPAVRFVQRNSPRPRNEPGQLDADEFLPWVQLVREGSTLEKPEMTRLFGRESLLDSMRLSTEARARLKSWITASKKKEGRDATAKELFYVVTAYFTESNAGFGTEVSHAILEREGNPMLALKAAYDMLGVPSEVYAMRSAYMSPLTHPMFSMQQYSDFALRVKLPESGEVVWLTSFSQDAMWGSVMPHHAGQPAICVSCAEGVEDVVAAEGARLRDREQRITATLQPDGKLVGQVRHTYEGDFAMTLRELFRKRQEPRQRQTIMENLTTSYLPGATVKSYEFEGLESRDEPLTLVMNFEREQFARKDASGALLIEASLFSPGIEPGYATLPARTTPMLIARPLEALDVLDITLPAKMSATLRSKEGSWTLESPFGTYSRSSVLEGGRLVISSEIDLDIQRIAADQYAEFQKWARATEQSSVILLMVK